VNLLEEAGGKWSGRSEKLFLEKEGIRQVGSKGKKKNGRMRTRRVLQADRESGERRMNLVLVGSKVDLFLEGRQCCDEVS